MLAPKTQSFDSSQLLLDKSKVKIGEAKSHGSDDWLVYLTQVAPEVSGLSDQTMSWCHLSPFYLTLLLVCQRSHSFFLALSLCAQSVSRGIPYFSMELLQVQSIIFQKIFLRSLK